MLKLDENVLKSRISEIDSNLEMLLDKGSTNDDVLAIMKELLSVTKIKNRMSDYLDE